MAFGLPQNTIVQLKSIFKKYPEITQVKIYGSRAAGHYRKGSDIDLAFFSESEKDLSSNLSWELDDLPSPYLFDLVNYNTLNKSPLKEEIDKYGKVFYKKTTKTSLSYSKKKSHFKQRLLHEQKSFLKQQSPIQQQALSEKEVLPEKKSFSRQRESSNVKASKTKNSFAFKQTEIGEMPEDWEVDSVNNRYIFSKKPKDLNFNKFKKIAFVPMNLIPNDKVILSHCIEKSSDIISNGVYFESGDLLLSKITPSFENGKQCIVKNIKNGFGIATTEIIPIKEKRGISDIVFLFYYLLLDNIRSEIAGKMEGTTGRKRVPNRVIKYLKIPLPPFTEQEKIAGILSQIQKAIEIQDKYIEGTKELKRSTMKQLFTYGVKEQKTKQTEIGEMPENWKIVNLGNVADIISGQSPKSEHYNKDGEGLPFYQGKIEFTETYIGSPKVWTSKAIKVAEKNDILLSVRAPVGPINIATQKSCIGRGLAAIHPRKINRMFLFHYLNSSENKIRGHGGTVFDSINREQVKLIKIPLPSPPEQEEIVDILTKIDQKIQIHKKKKASLEELFKAMLNKLMTGKIRVHRLNINTNLMRQKYV